MGVLHARNTKKKTKTLRKQKQKKQKRRKLRKKIIIIAALPYIDAHVPIKFNWKMVHLVSAKLKCCWSCEVCVICVGNL